MTMEPHAGIHGVAGLGLREELRPGDEAAIRRIIESSGFFSDSEIDIAEELVQVRRARGLESGYRFLFAEYVPSPPAGPEVVGYTCYGEIPCTVGAYDLYWIAVHSDQRGKGVGRWLLAESEARIAALGGRRVYIETSGRELYVPTQSFYTGCGYELEATFADFYDAGDSKLVYGKELPR